MNDKFALGIGSREAPDEVLLMMVRYFYAMAYLGVGPSSGDALGSDYACYVGYRLADCPGVKARIYLAENGDQGRYHKERPEFIDAETLVEHYDHAKKLALFARGSWNGLGKKGIKLHTRNSFQVMGDTLSEPVVSGILYARPQSNDTVKGGTNTAYQLVKHFKIPNVLNLYYDTSMRKVEDFLYSLENIPPIELDDAQILEIIRSRETKTPFF